MLPFFISTMALAIAVICAIETNRNLKLMAAIAALVKKGLELERQDGLNEDSKKITVILQCQLNNEDGKQ
jgi:hypothetical protein